jgi:hypothetical protein
MPEIRSIPRTIMRPACLKCSTPMKLARIAPDEEGIEDRIFELLELLRVTPVLWVAGS